MFLKWEVAGILPLNLCELSKWHQHNTKGGWNSLAPSTGQKTQHERNRDDKRIKKSRVQIGTNAGGDIYWGKVSKY